MLRLDGNAPGPPPYVAAYESEARGMNISKADVALLGRRALQPVKAEGELVAIFVGGKLVNPLNASAWGWQKRSRLAKKWKDAVATALMEWGRSDAWLISSKTPKVVSFLASTGGRMDGDGLQAALKPVRDALVECGVLSGDADKDGHTFHYAQRIDRQQRGVEIRIALKAAP